MIMIQESDLIQIRARSDSLYESGILPQLLVSINAHLRLDKDANESIACSPGQSLSGSEKQAQKKIMADSDMG